MKTHTNNYKNQIKQFGRELDSKITYTINGTTTELGSEQLNSVTPHYEGNILKSVMKQLDVDSNVEIPVGTIINYQFGVKVGNSYEYMDYGNYVVYETEKQEDTKSWKITCYDKMLYAMKPYENMNITYPITIKNYLQAICTKLGLTFGSANKNFTNADKQIVNELYLDADGNSLDYTYRDVLDELAGVTASTICINDNDELEVRYVENAGTYTTVTGSMLSLANCDDGKDVVYDLKGDTQQTSTPTPTSPVEVQTVTGRQDIKICQKNLIDISQTIIGKAWNNASNSARAVCYVQVQPSTAYTVSMDNLTGLDAVGIVEKVNISDTTSLSGVMSFTGERTITTTATTQYLGIQFAKTSITLSDITSHQIMVEKGSSKTTYEAYNGNTYEINFGKNLWGGVSFEKTSANVKYTTNPDGSIICDGTSSGTGGISLTSTDVANNKLYKVLPPGTYTLSSPDIDMNNVRVQAIKIVGTTTSQLGDNVTVSNSSITFTINEFTNVYVRISINAIGVVINKRIRVLLEKGSIATSYAEYKTPTELCKIGNYQDFIRKGTGKNLFNKNNLNYVGRYYVSNTGTVTASAYDKMIYVKLEPNTTYTFTQTARSNVTVRPSLFTSIPEVNSVGTVLGTFTGTGTITQTFTTTNTAIYFTWVYYNQNNLNGYTEQQMLDSIQIELGNQSTLFEPYGFDGKWYLYKTIGKYSYNSDLTLNAQDTNTMQFLTPVLNVGANLNSTTFSSISLCNLMGTSVSNYTGLNGTTSAKKIRVNIAKSITPTQADATTLFSNNNLTVYYKYDVPSATEITDTTLLSQLNAIELLSGINNIAISSGNLSTPLSLTYLSEMDTINEEYLKDVNVNFGEKYGPINSVVLSRSAESDNIYRNDQTSITENGLCEIKIKDNQILNGINRDDFIDNIFNKLNGLEYYINDYKSTGITYLNLLDRYKVLIDNNSYKCIMFNNEVDVTQGLEEQVYTEMPEESETDYSKADKTDRKINQAYIIVDKQNQEINSVVQTINTLQTTVNSQGEQINSLGTSITQTISNITANVTSIQDELDNGVSLVKTTSVTINDQGLNVSTDNSKISTTMTNNSFQIKDSGDNTLAFFGYDEVENTSKSQMDNLTVTTYLTAGNHRIESFERNGENRTGYFYIG